MSGKEKTNGSLAMAPRVITIPAANQEAARKRPRQFQLRGSETLLRRAECLLLQAHHR